MRTGIIAFPRALRLASALAAAAALAIAPAVTANALTEPTVPEPVVTYLASGLIPRLDDLYGPGERKGTGMDFSQAKVGTVHRVLGFTADYLGGTPTDVPTELTNTWVAPVTLGEDRIAGVATIWINPGTGEPELADFTIGPELAAALAAAPPETLLVRDDERLAWFATDGTTLTPLVPGGSGVTEAVSFADYQKTVDAAPQPVTAIDHGLVIAAVVLGIVVLALVVFVLLPVRRRGTGSTSDEEEVYGEEPDPED